MKKGKLFEVLIEFDIYEIGSTVSGETLISNNFSQIELLEAGIIKLISQEEKDFTESKYPKYIVGKIGNRVIIWERKVNSKYQYKSLLMSFQSLMNDNRFKIRRYNRTNEIDT